MRQRNVKGQCKHCGGPAKPLKRFKFGQETIIYYDCRSCDKMTRYVE